MAWDEGTDGVLPDEGMIHEWLDGQLDADASAAMERLVSRSPAFAARVAEARGLIAASARIVQSLDGVPGGVLPTGVLPTGVGSTGVGSADVRPSRPSPAGAPRARTVPWRRIGSIAALLMVGVTGVMLVQREPASLRKLALPAAAEQSVSTAPMVANDAGDALVPPVAASARVPAAPARDMPDPSALPSPISRTGERVAADPSLRPGLMVPDRKAEAAEAPVAARRGTVQDSVSDIVRTNERERRATSAAPNALLGALPGAPPNAPPSAPPSAPPGSAAVQRASAARAAAPVGKAADAAMLATSVEGGVPALPGDFAVAVQRVQCAPECVQRRIELVSDGRVRRWAHPLGGSAEPDTGRVAPGEVAALRTRLDSLGVSELPTTLRLDGSKCRSVGALRESLRVEFRVEGAPRSVMGLPWCSDGTHPLDRIAAETEALAQRALPPRP